MGRTVYVLKRKRFSFQGKESCDLPILGKTSLELLCERFGALPLSEEAYAKGDFVRGERTFVLFSDHPFLPPAVLSEAESAFCGGTVSFDGGVLLGEGEGAALTSDCGEALQCLSDYPKVLRRAKREVAERLLQGGVLLDDPDSTSVDYAARLAAGVRVMSGCRIAGNTSIGRGTVVGERSEIEDCAIGENVTVRASVLLGAKVGSGSSVGPYAFLRPGTEIGERCRIGDFVEIKNSSIGAETKVSHLAYVGDADVGRRVNIGCGAVFVNYDGRKKHRCRIGDECFIGSNCNLVAPVEMEEGSFLAAGTTLTRDLREGDFCVGRCRETIKPGRGGKYYG